MAEVTLALFPKCAVDGAGPSLASLGSPELAGRMGWRDAEDSDSAATRNRVEYYSSDSVTRKCPGAHAVNLILLGTWV
jgi:hypothetical protein